MYAAGVVPAELVCGHLLTQVAVLVMQVTLLLLCAFYAFALPLRGNLLLVFATVILLGLAGMLFGLTISAVVNREQEAIQVALGSLFPVLLLSGVLWPIESVPNGLRYVSYALPTTWGAATMRSVLNRGWGLEHEQSWQCFAVIGFWLLFLLLLARKVLRNRD